MSAFVSMHPDPGHAAVRPASTILVIDDDPAIRLPLERGLTHAGYRVIEAVDGQEGLEHLAARGDEVALIVIDNHMPRKSGAETIRELHERPNRPPIIMMSGVSFDESGLDPSRHTPEVFFRKPFKLTALLDAVHGLIGPAARSPNQP